jgi:apolipoprotein N-acyltransferase
MLKTLKSLSLPILSGFLIGTSYIPFPPWALFFCLTPLWIYWGQQTSYKKVFISGWLTQFILNFIGFHWIAYTVVEFGRMPWSAGVAVLFLFCTLAHLYYPIAGVLWLLGRKKLGLSPLASWVALPLIFALCERLYPYIFFWHLGYPWLWARLPGLHLGEWIGFFGLNLITLFINMMLAYALLVSRKRWRSPAVSTAVAIFFICQILGFAIGHNQSPGDKKLRALLVQGNIGNLDKLLSEHGGGAASKAVDTYLHLTRQALQENQDVDLVIWPETAFPETIYNNFSGPQRRRVDQLAQEFNVTILTGAYQREMDQKPYNSLVLLDKGKLVADYQKTVLLAFGEYFPFAEQFPKLKTWFPMVSDFGRGPGPSQMAWGQVNLGPQICYEGLFDEFSVRQQKLGVQLFVNVTNDSWFGYPFEPYQHMYMTLARAVENRRPLLRATNTGISTVILANGKVLQHSPIKKEWYGVYDVPYHSTPSTTFYANVGERWLELLSLALIVLFLGDKFARTRQH